MFLEVSTDLLREGYGVRFRAPGHSMHPTIRDGEMVTVEPLKATRVRRGDIILYRTKSGLIAHRVMLIESKEDEAYVFHLRGDASTSFDAPVSAEQILGRVVAVERDGHRIALTGRKARLSRAVRVYAAPIKVLVRTVIQRRSLLRI